MSNKELLQNEIEKLGKGSVFTPSDFAMLTNPDALRQSFIRLETSGLIRRIFFGVYEYPEFSELLGERIAVKPHLVAEALARNFSWDIVPSGDAALNILGLSTQVVSQWVYLSDGPYKKYNFDGIALEFKHATGKDIKSLSHKTALVVQGLKAIGRDNVTDSEIDYLSRHLSAADKETMLIEARRVTNWVYETIKRIYGGLKCVI